MGWRIHFFKNGFRVRSLRTKTVFGVKVAPPILQKPFQPKSARYTPYRRTRLKTAFFGRGAELLTTLRASETKKVHLLP